MKVVLIVGVLTLLSACSTAGSVASAPTNIVRGGSDGRAAFISIPVQPWFCDPAIDGYCPTAPRELPQQQ